MRTDETWSDGVLVERDIWDLDTSTYTREENGVVVSTRPLTAEEITALTPVAETSPAADALDAAADQAAQSLIADVRDLAVQLRAAADALRGQ